MTMTGCANSGAHPTDHEERRRCLRDALQAPPVVDPRNKERHRQRRDTLYREEAASALLEAPELGVDCLTQSPIDLLASPVAFRASENPVVPVSFVPTPTLDYRARRKSLRAAVTSARPSPPPTWTRAPAPLPLPLHGVRVLMWKQDPSVGE